MGGGIDLMDRRDAAALLQWWLDAGVDMPAAEESHDWLAASPPPETVTEAQPTPSPAMPDDLGEFRQWLLSSNDIPLAASAAKRIAPVGDAQCEIMLLAGIPTTADGDRPIGGDSWTLAEKMLAAIGFAAEQAYVANLLPFSVPGARMDDAATKHCADIAKHHVRLVKPKRLILLGDGPCQMLLGSAVANSRGKVHEVEGARAVATFAPKLLLDQPSYKARAWRDLLLLMEDRK